MSIWSRIHQWLFRSSSAWHESVSYFPVRLVDGTMGRGTLMRRFVNGEWQYRRLTADEEEDITDRRAW